MTGQKVIEFVAHVCKEGSLEVAVEVTAMTFDPEERRLITALKDGTVRLWNFHNGHCLREVGSEWRLC